MVKRTTVTVKRHVEPSPNKSAKTANHEGPSSAVLPKGAPGGIPKNSDQTKKGKDTTRAPGQGPGPSGVGMDNEVGSAVPARILTTHVVRRASHGNATLKPGRLVDYSKGLGK